MKFKYNLQTVLKVRKINENLAQSNYAESLALLAEEEQKLEVLQIAKTKAYEKLFQKTIFGGNSSPHLKQIEEFIRLQSVLIQNQKIKVQESQSIVEKMREILREKAIDYRIIETHRDKKKNDFEVKLKKEEQDLSDEMSILRYKPGKKNEESV